VSEPDLLGRVPSAVREPEAAEPSRFAARGRGWNRRRFFSAAGGVTIAAGLGALDLLPWSRPRGAPALTEWTDGCHGHYDAVTICHPSTAYFGANNCTGEWHRQEEGSGVCYQYRYIASEYTCDGRNAWRWQTGEQRRKCSDGWYEYYDCDGVNISRFSICRTEI